ncbi:MAG: FAD-dependent oxidoreductase [Chlamydiota bacterium]|jgi:NADH dehydrogenase
MSKKRIVILGGGFGGVYTAMHLEKQLGKIKDYEIALINRENYFVYQPMLAEVVGGSVGIIDTVSSLQRRLPKTTLYIRDIESIDLEKKAINLYPQFSHKPSVVHYDHLVVGLGNVTDFRATPGLHEHALPFKNLSDALRIRNHIIDTIEAASTEADEELKKALLTYVIGGGGFSGTEIAAEINDLVRNLAKKYPTIDPGLVKVYLIHSKERVLERELSESLSNYAGKILQKRGVDIQFGKRLATATPAGAILDDETKLNSKTVISTVPSSPNPLLEHLKLPQEKGKIKVDATMQVQGEDCIWAIGDCAQIPDLQTGSTCPPTAQFAIREAKVLARNIVNVINGRSKTEFKFKSLGMLGALGHHSAVAELFGFIKISGFVAWFMWRLIYWMKLPGFDRKLKVAISWFLDMIIPIEAVQLKLSPSQGINSLHFEPGDIIFHEGDIGDYLYIIVKGKVEILKKKQGEDVHVANLGEGEFFGEMSLLNEKRRNATVKCVDPSDILAIRKSDFGALIANFPKLKEQIKSTEETRKEH